MNAFEVVGNYILKGAERAGSQIRGLSESASSSALSIDKVSEKIDKLGQGVSATGDKMSKWVTGPLAAAGVGILALSQKAATATKEIEKYSNLTGETVENFQAQAFAANSVGIEMDKYGDILKDVQDRVGDFLTTGGGPMADFFENIGPKVGVTAEQFRGLSGKDSLQLFVSSLEKAGVGSQEMTFYMEAMAGDAAALIPLFKENGKQLNSLSDRAREAGLVLSSELIEGSKDGRKSLAILGATFEALTTKIGVSLLPVMESIVPVITGVVVPAINSFAATIRVLVGAFNLIPGPIQGMILSMIGFVAVVGPLLSITGRLISAFATFGPLLTILKVGFAALATVSAPFILVAVGIASAITGIYLAVTNWSAISEFATNVWSKFTSFLSESLGGIGGKILSSLKSFPRDIMNFFSQIGSNLINWANSVVSNVVNKFRSMFSEITGIQTRASTAGLESSMSLNSTAPAAQLRSSGGVGGSNSSTYVDMRNSVFRDDRDMLDRLRRQGQGLTGGFA